MDKEDIETINLVKNNSSDSYLIEIEFKDHAIDIWRKATLRNIDKSIVLLLDERVISSPMIRSEIMHGKCEISGNVSVDKYKKALPYLCVKALLLCSGSLGRTPFDSFYSLRINFSCFLY